MKTTIKGIFAVVFACLLCQCVRAEERNIIASGGAAPLPASLLAAGGEKELLILADELLISGGTYRCNPDLAGTVNCAQNVTLVADTIRWEGACSFDLSAATFPAPNGGADTYGGDLTIIANRIVWGRGGSLSFTSFGQAPSRGGRLRVYVAESLLSLAREEQLLDLKMMDGLEVEPGDSGAPISEPVRARLLQIATKAAEGPEAARTAQDYLARKSVWDDDLVSWTLVSARAVKRKELRSVSWIETAPLLIKSTPRPLLPNNIAPNTPDPRTTGSTQELGFTPPVSDEGLLQARSTWKLRMLQMLANSLRERSVNEQWSEFAQLLARLIGMQSVSIVGNQAAQAQALLDRISELRERAPVVIEERIAVRLGNRPEKFLTVYSILGDGRVYAAPTMLLLQPVHVKDKVYSGFVTLENNRSRVDFTARLSISPADEAALRQTLESAGRRYGGVFTRWILTPRDITSPGINTTGSKITVTGYGIAGTLLFDPESGSVQSALAKFADAGIPIDFDWQLTQAGRAARGTLSGLTLSRSRADFAALRMDDERLSPVLGGSHPSRYVAVPTFAVTPEGRIVFLPEPAPTLAPGQSAPLPSELRGVRATIPAEAIRFDVGGEIGPAFAFRVPDREDLVQTFRIGNRLPARDGLTGAYFTKLVVRIAYLSGDGLEEQIVSRTLSLDEEQVVRFLSNLGNPKLYISGTVTFENGGSVDLIPWITDSTSIDIDERRLMRQP